MTGQAVSITMAIAVAFMCAVATVAADDCGEQTTVALITSDGIEAGTVTARNDGSVLNVDFAAGETWRRCSTRPIAAWRIHAPRAR